MRAPRRPRRRGRRLAGPDTGEPTVLASNEQHVCVIDPATWQALAEKVLAAEGVRGEAEMSLLFVDTVAMAELNAQFMGVDGPTDVLSFPIDATLAEPGRYPDGGAAGPDRSDPDPDDLPLLLGDVVICPEVAAANAPGHAGNLDDELALLVVHGVLHVLGMDHAEPGERNAMWARERQHLEALWRLPQRDPWVTEPDEPLGAGDPA